MPWNSPVKRKWTDGSLLRNRSEALIELQLKTTSAPVSRKEVLQFRSCFLSSTSWQPGMKKSFLDLPRFVRFFCGSLKSAGFPVVFVKHWSEVISEWWDFLTSRQPYFFDMPAPCHVALNSVFLTCFVCCIFLKRWGILNSQLSNSFCFRHMDSI